MLVVRFDREVLAVRGDPAPVADGMVTKLGAFASFAASRKGSLVYQTGDAFLSELVWVDRSGQATLLRAPPRGYYLPRLSPDGTRVAVADMTGTSDVWVLDIDRGTLTPITFDPGVDMGPLWSPDGRELYYRAGPNVGEGLLTVRSADGAGEPRVLSKVGRPFYPSSLSPDGRYLAYSSRGVSASDIELLDLATGESRPLIHSPHDEFNAEISPDGRLIAYQSDESGRPEVYVRPFPDVGGARWQISAEGGSEPTWSRAGAEIFFLDPDGRMMSVSYDARDGFLGGRPVALFKAPPMTGSLFRSYDVAPDGKRFVMQREATEELGRGQIVLVQNLGAELERSSSPN